MNCHIGSLNLETLPRIVGTISTCKALFSVASLNEYTCDIVEVRLDEIGHNLHGWMSACQAIEAAGFPVLLTLRLTSEGGKWNDQDENRNSLFSGALHNLACIDIESTSKLRNFLCNQAQEEGKNIIVSYHNFQRTPNFCDLSDVLQEILDIPCAIPKISTMIVNDADVDTLRDLLAVAKERPTCIIGMGSKGTKSRLLFPSLGSCLSYGYIDSPIAPGQLSSSVLVQHLRQSISEYN